MAKGIVAVALPLVLQGMAPASFAMPAERPAETPAESPVCDDAPAGQNPKPVIFPTTRQAFTLPPDANTQALPCPDLPPPPVRPRAPNIFGSVALPVKSTGLDWRWDQARAAIPDGIFTPSKDIVARAQHLADREKLALVNSWINSTIRFTEDRDRDHWASAAETFRNGAGDCEDFAIAKLALLQDAGVPIDSLFLVIVRDTARNTDHAVLGVRLDGRMLVLDSRTDRILPSSMISDYHPIFSFSGAFAWTHGYEQGAAFMPGK